MCKVNLDEILSIVCLVLKTLSIKHFKFECYKGSVVSFKQTLTVDLYSCTVYENNLQSRPNCTFVFMGNSQNISAIIFVYYIYLGL